MDVGDSGIYRRKRWNYQSREWRLINRCNLNVLQRKMRAAMIFGMGNFQKPLFKPFILFDIEKDSWLTHSQCSKNRLWLPTWIFVFLSNEGEDAGVLYIIKRRPNAVVGLLKISIESRWFFSKPEPRSSSWFNAQLLVICSWPRIVLGNLTEEFSKYQMDLGKWFKNKRTRMKLLKTHIITLIPCVCMSFSPSILFCCFFLESIQIAIKQTSFLILWCPYKLKYSSC